MVQKKEAWMGNIVARKLLFCVLIISSVASLFLTAAQLYWDYRIDVNLLKDDIDKLRAISLESIAGRLWDLDLEGIQVGLNGIKRMQDVEYVQLINPNVEIPALGVEPPQSSRSSEWLFDLTYYHPGLEKTVVLGQLRIVATLERIYQRVFEKALFVLLGQFIKTIIVSIFILFAVRLIVIRHLARIKAFVNDHRVNSKTGELNLVRTGEPFAKRRDEIDVVAEVINDVVHSLETQKEITEEQLRLTQIAEEKLKKSNDQLISQLQDHLNTITEQRQNLEESSRLAALGQMAGGIAHEINNPLAIIEGNCQRILMSISSELNAEALQKRLGKIIDMVARISAIVTSLRVYSRQDRDIHDAQGISPLKPIVTDTLVLCQERFRRHQIKVTLQEVSSDVKIRCNPIAISQVIINLLNNSIDAIKDHDSPWIKVGFETTKDQVMLSVTDSGHGIPAEIRHRITDPFFTTKPVGKGTGLGLSISKAIALSHEGILEYDANSPNTRFVLTLPRAEDSSS